MSKATLSISNIPCDEMNGQLINWLKNHTGIRENLDGPSTDCNDQVVYLELSRFVRDFDGTYKSDELVRH